MSLKKCLTAFAAVTSLMSASQDFWFYSASRNVTYEVQSTKLSTALTFGGHWLYEPSVILPSALTGNQYVLLFSSNNGSSQSIFMSTSTQPAAGFSSPQAVLGMGGTNLCDMIGASPNTVHLMILIRLETSTRRVRWRFRGRSG